MMGLAWVIFFSLFFSSGAAHARRSRVAPLKSVTKTFNNATILSDEQQKLSDNVVVFRGNVNMFIDESIYITADSAAVSMESKICTITANKGSFVKIEQDQITILATSCSFDLNTGLGSATDLRMHSVDSAASAKEGFRRADGSWILRSVLYTPCQHDSPHWQFLVAKAVLKKNKKITLQGAFFCIKGVPLLPLPVYTIALNKKKAQGGFLMPSFYWDERHGYGIKMGYYVPIAEHLDTTFGVYWATKKGFVVSDELRWATSLDQFAKFSATYAKEWDVLQEFDNTIASRKSYYYLIQGDYYDLFNFGTQDIRTITHVDIGSDKRFGYRFFNDVGGLDDCFINQWVVRAHRPNRIFEISCMSDNTRRNQIYTRATAEDIANNITKETKVRVLAYHLPHIETNSIFHQLWQNIYYRDDIFFDYVALKERMSDTFFRDTTKTSTLSLVDISSDTMRFFYRGNMSLIVPLKSHLCRVSVRPELQTRSRLYHYDAYESKQNPYARPHVQADIEWNFPSVRRVRAGNIFSFQASLQALLEPVTYQNDWLLVDRYDRWYQSKNVRATGRFSWMWDQYFVSALVTSGVTAAEHKKLFSLDRDPSPGFQLPLTMMLDFAGSHGGLSVKSECSWNPQSQFLTFFTGHLWSQLAAVHAELDYVYLPRKTAQDRSLLTDISHFFKASISLKVGPKITIEYDGNYFLSHEDRTCVDTLKPLSHRGAISYAFDCWRVMFGFEERRYKDFGQWRADHAFVFSVRLDTLGSYAQRFKRPGSLFDYPIYT